MADPTKKPSQVPESDKRTVPSQETAKESTSTTPVVSEKQNTTQTPKPSTNVSTPTELRPGYTVRVYQKIQQADKERIQMFEGVILAKKGKDDNSRTITVRKIASGGYGVEKIFPLASPMIEKIEVVHKPHKVRQSKLYYVRQSPRKIKELREQK